MLGEGRLRPSGSVSHDADDESASLGVTGRGAASARGRVVPAATTRPAADEDAAAAARALVGEIISPPHVGQAGLLDPLTGASTTSPQSEHFNNRVGMACRLPTSPEASVPCALAKSSF